MRMHTFILPIAAVCLLSRGAHAHELWFRPGPGGDAAVVRLFFADTPAPGEAERVDEIARTRVWADGKPLEVRRLTDGLEARLPAPPPRVVSAFADRGVVTYRGDTFVIFLAAYAQGGPITPAEAGNVGLDDDQLRLNLVSGEDGKPVIRAVRRGRPVATSIKVFRGDEAPTEIRTDDRGEVPCPDLARGPLSLLAQVVEKAPGRRDGKAYSEVRYKATLAVGLEAQGKAPATSECLSRVKEVHGAVGPWAVAGYRMGERALKEFALPRYSVSLLVIHRCPTQVQYSCIADGLQAATGASPGKLNLRLEEASADKMTTVISDRRSGRSLTFTLKPEFVLSVSALPHDRLEAEGRRVGSLRDDEIFSVSE